MGITPRNLPSSMALVTMQSFGSRVPTACRARNSYLLHHRRSSYANSQSTFKGGFQVPIITFYPLSLGSTNPFTIIDHITLRDYLPIMPNKVVLISGASTGFGALAARLIAQNGNTVYACVREHE
jgi:hypothetical protein